MDNTRELAKVLASDEGCINVFRSVIETNKKLGIWSYLWSPFTKTKNRLFQLLADDYERFLPDSYYCLFTPIPSRRVVFGSVLLLAVFFFSLFGLDMYWAALMDMLADFTSLDTSAEWFVFVKKNVTSACVALIILSFAFFCWILSWVWDDARYRRSLSKEFETKMKNVSSLIMAIVMASMDNIPLPSDEDVIEVTGDEDVIELTKEMEVGEEGVDKK